LISGVAQAANFILRTGSMIVLARLLLPQDFGLVGMVTAFTGFLGLFRDVGLSMATVQRASISHGQTSTLFWVNLVVGGLLTALCAAAAPFLVSFYAEPRLFWVTVALGAGFFFNGAAAQHRAMLQRDMQFGRMAIVDISALLLSIAAAVGGAAVGMGYWALVIMATGFPAAAAAGVWLANRWVPGSPQRGMGIRSMLWYGGTVTLSNVVYYLAYNMDKVLLGRFFGAEILGIYGRAYQLVNLPTENLNSTMGLVAFPALSRIQDDPVRLREYFLKGYAFYVSLVVPITVVCALFSDDIIQVMLGPKWDSAVPIFRLLAPTILVFAFLNPLSWLMLAAGHAGRSLKMAFLVAPVVILGYAIGITHGPHGVAAGFSIAMLLLVIPVVSWAKQGTLITWSDIIKAGGTPFLSVTIGAGVVWLLAGQLPRLHPALLRLTVESAVLSATYLVVLMFVFRQWSVFAGLLRETGLWRGRQSPKQDT
jgi:PST family polysaccharide transporter